MAELERMGLETSWRWDREGKGGSIFVWGLVRHGEDLSFYPTRGFSAEL